MALTYLLLMMTFILSNTRRFAPLHIIQSWGMLYNVLILSYAYHIMTFLWFGSFRLVCDFHSKCFFNILTLLFGPLSL